MTLERFIGNHRGRQKRDECGDLNMLGKRGTICESGDGTLFAVTVMWERAKTALWWNAQREALKATGCRIIQNGDREGTALFDSSNPEQVKAALKAIKAIRRPELSPEHLQALIEHGAKHRFRSSH